MKRLLVNRNDFSETALVESDMAALADGHIRVSVGPFALTANNITYMVTGDQIGYWQYFEPKAYDLMPEGDEGKNWGCMPVWGYGQVSQSKCSGVEVGTKIYGFLPVTDAIDMLPVKLSPSGFIDGAAHRKEGHPVYNTYSLTAADPSFGANEDLQPVLRPLFTTSFLIDDFLDREEFFGAEQILMLSASSKTALGTAYCLSARGDRKVTGLTSSGNVDFVKGTGFYGDVYSYDNIADMDASVKTAIVDMAGNGEVTTALYEHFGENIVYNCMVGKSHWEGKPPKRPTAGAPPVMFFAPDQAKQRFADWGAEGFAKKLGARWMPFCASAADWMNLSHEKGHAPFMTAYDDFLAGRAKPADGKLFSL
ncbi:MAG: DUF2855 family protein [Maricaulaceae bacterium]